MVTINFPFFLPSLTLALSPSVPSYLFLLCVEWGRGVAFGFYANGISLYTFILLLDFLLDTLSRSKVRFLFSAVNVYQTQL